MVVRIAVVVVMLGFAGSIALPNAVAADWAHFEEGLAHLAEGAADDAARDFEAEQDSPMAAVSSLAADLAEAYARLGPKKERKAKALLFKLAKNAAAAPIAPEVFDEAIRRAREHLGEEPAARPQVRMLLCHLKLLSRAQPAADDVHEINEEDWQPTPVLSFYPEYTDAARKQCVQGTVFSRAIIDADGCTTGVSVVEGLPFGLTESTVRTQLWSVYVPVEIGGEATAVYAGLTTSFQVSCGERGSC